jgi:integrase
MRPRFYARDGVIYIRYTINYKTQRVSTGINIPSGAQFDKAGQFLTGRDRTCAIVNSNLAKIYADTSEVIIRDIPFEEKVNLVKRLMSNHESPEIDSGAIPLHRFVYQMYEDIKSGALVKKTGGRYSISVLKHLHSIFLLTRRMSVAGNDYYIDDMDVSTGGPTRKRTVTEKHEKFFVKLKAEMINSGLSVNTQSKYVSVLNEILTYAEKKHYVTLLKFNSLSTEDKPVIALPDNVIKEFLSIDHLSINPIELRFVYEICYVMLTTSLRVSDALSIKIHDISKSGDNYMLSGYINNKTGERTYCPIPDRLYRMLEANQKFYGRVYSVEPEYRMVRDLTPRLFKMLDSAHVDISISNMKPDRSGYERKMVKLYEIVTPHMMRRSAITSMLHNGVPERVVKYTSGHSQNSKSFERYVGYVDKVYNDEMIKYQKALFSS